LAGLLIWLQVPITTIFVVAALPVLLSGLACGALERVVRGQTISSPAAELREKPA